MANHGYVTTRKHMKAEVLTEFFNDINSKYLFDEFNVEYSDCRNNPGAWGKHVWDFQHKRNEKIYKVCWLNNPRSFEIRHGGGGNFVWWLDSLITNEVACFYDGNIGDDGYQGKEKGKPGLYQVYKDYAYYMCRHHDKGLLFFKKRLSFYNMDAPEKFRF